MRRAAAAIGASRPGRAFAWVMPPGPPGCPRRNHDQARRFVTLIDALYEAGVRLVASAECEPEALYPDDEGSFEFERTISRLREMQGADWGR